MAKRKRNIIHVDMDAFFASVEIHDKPELAGKCVIVGGSAEGRGVVSAASYEARKYGVHSAMPTAQAKRLCPNGIFLPVRMGRYKEFSLAIREIFFRFTPLVEPLSVDEAFLDVTDSKRIWGSAEQIGRLIKKTIHEETGLVASVGIAPNKFLAKLASDLDKPDGFFVITEENKLDVLRGLDIGRMWGVGKVTGKKLQDQGIRTFGDLQDRDVESLRYLLGNAAEDLKKLSMGEDEREVEISSQAKSISQEETFETDVGDKDVLAEVLLGQVEKVAMRLRDAGLRAGGVTLKFRYGNFKTITRSHKLGRPTHSTSTLFAVGREVFEKWWRSSGGPLRLLGFGVDRLSEERSGQLELFEENEDGKQDKVDKAVDEIKKKFGNGVIKRGGA
ncbi:DNA polymerase IV [Anaerohalosphaera lusitana]|nr:DNA polymerase IV [Anaerohalosphaera lusitana]